jgi:hypothetical protein
MIMTAFFDNTPEPRFLFGSAKTSYPVAAGPERPGSVFRMPASRTRFLRFSASPLSAVIRVSSFALSQAAPGHTAW